MIIRDTFTLDHIMHLRGSSNVDPGILERNIYALSLLDALITVGMPFIFKGGTSLTLLLDTPRRLSTDIDIVVAPGTDVDHYLTEAATIFPFKSMERQVRRGRGGIEKRHYQFRYDSPAFGTDFYILLDILYEENHYSRLIRRSVDNALLLTAAPYNLVTMPSADCIMGDKLTAFAPHTIGIPYGIQKELEIVKQMYDIASLFDIFEDSEDVYKSYMATATSEIAYRGGQYTITDALTDSIEASICVAGRGQIGNDYDLLLSGIRKLHNHIYADIFNADLAVLHAGKVMYAAACILKHEEMHRIEDLSAYRDMHIQHEKYRKLEKLRNLNVSAFAYVVEALRLYENS